MPAPLINRLGLWRIAIHHRKERETISRSGTVSTRISHDRHWLVLARLWAALDYWPLGHTGCHWEHPRPVTSFGRINHFSTRHNFSCQRKSAGRVTNTPCSDVNGRPTPGAISWWCLRLRVALQRRVATQPHDKQPAGYLGLRALLALSFRFRRGPGTWGKRTFLVRPWPCKQVSGQVMSYQVTLSLDPKAPSSSLA